ncbi:hypothetical protein [Streptomyces cacaoi]|uniref:Uncharacterized protein n=1 Tax=Streptomyces cacaoi TaxID=1898 RepID=A0A4Y3QX97_STRCI|nr:hypothetical protein [Streptomyces cacaoi]NNG83620.1 hypothetical protein [Streptomyces cacaoi]GEB50046.1 hypothetical protein SCA03_25970 [Streptomyces cacaoi]
MRIACWERDFRLWHYTFSYSQLLLRSAPRNDEDTRIDVLFSNVCHMSVPARLAGLTIEEDVPEGGLPEGAVAEPGFPYKEFRLNGGLARVYATRCQWHEDHAWLDAPSHFGPLRGVK